MCKTNKPNLYKGLGCILAGFVLFSAVPLLLFHPKASSWIPFNIPVCRFRATIHEESYSGEYTVRNRTIDIEGAVYSHYQWDGQITRADFDRTLIASNTALTIKIRNNRLYERTIWDDMYHKEVIEYRRSIILNQISLVLQFYLIPDLDLTFILKDEVECGIPFVYYSLDESCGYRAGFTIPSYDAFRRAFGPEQLDIYINCLQTSYPWNSERIQKAFWRGSTTGVEVLNMDTVSKAYRVQLARKARYNEDIMDVAVTAHIQLDRSDTEIDKYLKAEAPLARYFNMELANEYALLLDLDGNAWSDRLKDLLVSNTPILKQESPFKEHFAHELESQSLVRFFKRNLNDVEEKIREFLDIYNSDEGIASLEAEISRRHQFARDRLTQLGILRATAYTLTIYASKQTWTVVQEDGYREVTSKMYNPSDRDHYPKKLKMET